MVLENRSLLEIKGNEKVELWGKVRRKHGIWKAVDAYLFMKLHRKFVRSREDRKKTELLFGDRERVRYLKEVPTVEVGSVSDDKAFDFVSRLSPDLICVCGTSVIKPRIFNLARHGAINIHVGITPEYRSAKPIEWALHNKDYDNIGVTVHFVDEGVDTGDIIHQGRIDVTGEESLAGIYAKCKILGCDLMLRAISEIENGTVRRWRKEGVAGRKYTAYEFGLSNYVRTWIHLKRGNRCGSRGESRKSSFPTTSKRDWPLDIGG